MGNFIHVFAETSLVDNSPFLRVFFHEQLVWSSFLLFHSDSPHSAIFKILCRPFFALFLRCWLFFSPYALAGVKVINDRVVYPGLCSARLSTSIKKTFHSEFISSGCPLISSPVWEILVHVPRAWWLARKEPFAALIKNTISWYHNVMGSRHEW